MPCARWHWDEVRNPSNAQITRITYEFAGSAGSPERQAFF